MTHGDRKRCAKCGGSYPLPFFAKRHGCDTRITLRPVCKGCEQTERDRVKKANRFLQKARDSIRRHGRRLVEQGKIKFAVELQTIYRWDAYELAHDFEHAYKNGCGNCRKLFASMANGLSDMSIDITDRNRPPYYKTNTRIWCMTCNRDKGDMTPDEFEEHQLGWKLWEDRQVELRRNPPPRQKRLFEDEDAA